MFKCIAMMCGLFFFTGPVLCSDFTLNSTQFTKGFLWSTTGIFFLKGAQQNIAVGSQGLFLLGGMVSGLISLTAHLLLEDPDKHRVEKKSRFSFPIGFVSAPVLLYCSRYIL